MHTKKKEATWSEPIFLYQPELWVKHTGLQGRKDRELKLPPEIIPVFEDYVKQYAITDILFCYTPRFIELLFASTAKQAKLHKKVTAGILRDIFVVRSVKRGAKLEDAMRKIGLSESSWEDARIKYTRLASGGMSHELRKEIVEELIPI